MRLSGLWAYLVTCLLVCSFAPGSGLAQEKQALQQPPTAERIAQAEQQYAQCAGQNKSECLKLAIYFENEMLKKYGMAARSSESKVDEVYFNRAFELNKMACDLDNAKNCRSVAFYYIWNEFVTGEAGPGLDEAVNKACNEKSVPECMTIAGLYELRYNSGLNRKDMVEAIKWYKKGCDLGLYLSCNAATTTLANKAPDIVDDVLYLYSKQCLAVPYPEHLFTINLMSTACYRVSQLYDDNGLYAGKGAAPMDPEKSAYYLRYACHLDQAYRDGHKGFHCLLMKKFIERHGTETAGMSMDELDMILQCHDEKPDICIALAQKYADEAPGEKRLPDSIIYYARALAAGSKSREAALALEKYCEGLVSSFEISELPGSPQQGYCKDSLTRTFASKEFQMPVYRPAEKQ